MLDGMDSTKALWQNRRVQRSGLFVFFVLTFIIIGLYSRTEWPAATYLNGGLSEETRLPLAYGNEAPIHDPNHPEFDTNNMPKISSSASKKKSALAAKASANAKALAKNPSHDMNLDPTRVAMIIETRKLPHLPALLLSYIGILPPQWVIRMIGTPDAFENIKESLPLQRAVSSGKLVLTDLPDEYPVAGQEQISATLTNLTFYRDFLAPAEWLLIFQADAVLCAASDQSLDDWVDRGYPWVGAPWNPDVPGGNGGLSLRYIPRLISILEKESRQPGDPFWEDRWLCDRIPDTALPPLTKYFSVESVFYERPLGYHLRGSGKMLDLTVWGNETRKRHIFRYCPETKLILGNMRLEDEDDEKNEAAENRANRGSNPPGTGDPVTQPVDATSLPKAKGVSTPPKHKSTLDLIKDDETIIKEMESVMSEKEKARIARHKKEMEEQERQKAWDKEHPEEAEKRRREERERREREEREQREREEREQREQREREQRERQEREQREREQRDREQRDREQGQQQQGQQGQQQQPQPEQPRKP